MQWVLEQVCGPRDLHHAPHDNTVRDMADNRQIVSDEEILSVYGSLIAQMNYTGSVGSPSTTVRYIILSSLAVS
jgi:hypothetical protein